jgi:RHS repeat-associated protein
MFRSYAHRPWRRRSKALFESLCDFAHRYGGVPRAGRPQRTVLGLLSLEDRLTPALTFGTGLLANFCPTGDCDPLANATTVIPGQSNAGDSWTLPAYEGTPGKVTTLPHNPNDPSQNLPAQPLTATTGNLANTFSDGPVRYADGVIKLSTTDIASDGFGTPFAQVRSWSNDPSYAMAANGANGDGWVDSQFLGLVKVDGTTSLAVVGNGTSVRFFDVSGGGYVERFFGQNVLGYDGTNDQYVLTTPEGVSFRFEGFSTSLPLAQRGQFVSRTDPFGNVAVVTSRDGSGRITEVQRGGSAEGQTVTESWVYGYLGSLDPNAGLLASVTLRRKVGSGSWDTVQSVDYTYYDGTDGNGNLGDLQTATIKNADGNNVGTNYYRYYTSDSAPGYTHGLKYYLSPASFDHAYGDGYDPVTATDAHIAPYADNYFEYNADHRVSLERVQGQGCSACSGGLGEYTFSYTPSDNDAGFNSWSMRTVETLPDGNENIVYTNAYGEVMLKAFHDTTTDQRWINFYKYDGSGRTVMAADPSAVSGYDDTHADLLHWTDGAAGGPEIAVNTTTTGHQFAPAVGSNADGYSVVVWASADADGWGIFARQFNPDGTPAGDEFQVNTTTTGDQIQPAVAVAADGSYFVAWRSPDGWNDGIAGRRFAANGDPLDTDQFWVSTTVYGPQWDPAVGFADDGSAVVIWSDSYNGRIDAQRYATDGTADGSEFYLSDSSSSSYGHITARLSVASDGSFAAGWVVSDGSTFMDFVVRTFAADGTATSDEEIVRSGFWLPCVDVKLAADGSVLATWQTADSWGNGIFARVRNPEGEWGDPNLVPVAWVGDQMYESSAALPGGGWVVAWENEFTTAGDFQVYGRSLAPDGTPIGDDFQVNVTTDGNQTAVRLAPAPGGFLAVWQSDGQDSDGLGVYTRQFGAGYEFLNDRNGLITNYDYYTSTTAGDGIAGGVDGFVKGMSIQQGETGVAIRQLDQSYYQFTHTTEGLPFNPLATSTIYRNDDGAGAETTTYSYTFYSGTGQVESVTVSLPVVGTSQNGPGMADTATSVFDQYGRVEWSKDGGGFLTYFEYDSTTGALTKEIMDVDTTQTTTFADLPDDWETPDGGGLHLTMTADVDGLGRITKYTSPEGRVTYQIYDDVNHEVRDYEGWDATAHAPTGPTVVTRFDRLHGYIETLTMSAAPNLDGSDLPDGTEDIDDVQTLSRTYLNDAGQAVTSDAYFDLSGLTYSDSTSLGTSGTNFYRTQQDYDHRGRANKTISPTGTITREEYDGLGRLVSVWVGTDDTPTSGYWSPDNLVGTNMVKVSEYEYDKGEVGDSNLTTSTDYPGGGADDRVNLSYYDWRNRLVATKVGAQVSESDGTHRPIYYTEYDNLNEAVSQEQYDGDGVDVTTTAGLVDRPDASLLRAKTTSTYDDQGRVYRSDIWSVDSADGAVSTYSLHTDAWYDQRGNVIKNAAPGGLVTKSVFDGVGRPIVTYSTDGGGDAALGASGSWDDAGSVNGDAVLQQQESYYDADGNLIMAVTRQRFHDETATGDLNPATYILPAILPDSRTYFATYYYDAAERPTATVDVGTNGGSDYTWPGTVPSRSDTVLVTTLHYNDAGWVDRTVDPRGIETRTAYDALGRTVQTIENYVDGTPSDADDKTTQFTYDGSDHLLTYSLLLPSSGIQTTQYVYGVSTSTIHSNDLLAAVYHPNATTGTASSSEADSYVYNALGQQIGFTDRNGTAHEYSYDVLGRPTADTVTTFGDDVDDAVQRLETAYDTQGNAYLFTSLNAAEDGDVVNQVLRQFNGLGQLTAEYQAHSGAVDTESTPFIGYAYSEMASGANHSRLTSLIYPDGFTVNYNYASGLDNTISRLSSLSNSSTTLEAYTYLGLDTVVTRSHPQPGVDLTYINSYTGGGAGDQYGGLDLFGRVVDQQWKTSSVDVDRYQYGYDRDSNRLFQDDKVTSGHGEVFAYDDLNQLTGYQRGTLNTGRTAITGTVARSQDWTMDAAGNFTGISTNGTPVSSTFDKQNEPTTLLGETADNDANGNLLNDQDGHTYVYDAWNRLVSVGGAPDDVSYAYDALSRRVIETIASNQRDLYTSALDQVAEEAVNDVWNTRQVWSPVYVDALVLRDRDANSNAGDGLEERLYAAQDANWDVTALITASGTVVARFTYDPYGTETATGSDYQWKYLHQGLRYESEVQLYDNRARAYSPVFMRFLQNDPIGFRAGDQDTYRYEGDNPSVRIDPNGLQGKRPIPGQYRGRGCWDADEFWLRGGISPGEDHDTYYKGCVGLCMIRIGSQGKFPNLSPNTKCFRTLEAANAYRASLDAGLKPDQGSVMVAVQTTRPGVRGVNGSSTEIDPTSIDLTDDYNFATLHEPRDAEAFWEYMNHSLGKPGATVTHGEDLPGTVHGNPFTNYYCVTIAKRGVQDKIPPQKKK